MPIIRPHANLIIMIDSTTHSANIIKVIDQEGQILFSCPIEEREKAFQFATEMESLGVEVKLEEPSLPETLANHLGMNSDEAKEFREAIHQEIEDHDTGCCFQKKAIQSQD